MTGTPEAGWYSDPADAKQLRYWDGNAWSNQIRASESSPGAGTPRSGLPVIGIVGIVAAGLLAVGGITAILLNSGRDSDTPGGTATDTTEHTAPEVVVPEGWDLFVSRSGSVEYAVDPDWTDAWTPEYEAYVLSSTGMDNAEMELAGTWITDGSQFTGDTILMVVLTGMGAPPVGSLEIGAEEFVKGTSLSSGDSPYEVVLSQGMTLTQGYEAWRLDHTLTFDGTAQNASVVIFEYETTVGFVYIISPDPFDQWLPGFLSVVDSLVLVKPPVSP